MKKAYLGDAVYAELNQYGELVLTTEDGLRATNTIVLDQGVLKSLTDLIKSFEKVPTRKPWPPCDGNCRENGCTCE